jgi:hypothetical protein
LLGGLFLLSGCAAGAAGSSTASSRAPSAPSTTRQVPPSTAATTTTGPKSQLQPLSPPAPLAAFSTATIRGGGKWHRAGRLVDGKPAIFETSLVPPLSSYPAGIAWMDTRLLKAQLYSGSLSPGGGPWHYTAPISAVAARSLVAAFNGGFKFPATKGGYYSEGKLVYPLRTGGASLVIYKDGTVTVGAWGSGGLTMTSDVMAVRQNLTLLVTDGHPVAGLNPNDTTLWGSVLGSSPHVWRSGLGVTKDGALVYVYGPYLDITQLAALLVRAGCVRAMTLDMNPDWTVFATYDAPPGAPVTPSDGSSLLPGTVQGPATFFASWWARDFVTMSAR